MTHFSETISNISSKLYRDSEAGSAELEDTILFVEEKLMQTDISLRNIVRRWRKEPKLQDERKFKNLRLEGDKAFQNKNFEEAMKKYR